MQAVGPWTVLLCKRLICLFVCAAVGGASILRAEELRTPSQRQGMRTIDELRQQRPPEGNFDGWCGFAGGFLLTKGQRFYDIERFFYGQATAKPVKLSLQPRGYIMGCDARGEYLVYSDVAAQAATKLRIEDQTTTLFAKFRDAGQANLRISLSPDLNTIAFDPDAAELEQNGNPDNVRLLPLERSARWWNRHAIGWKNDSSMLFHVVETKESAEHGASQGIEVVNLATGTKTTGKLPVGFAYRASYRPDGVFVADGRELLLFLRPIEHPSSAIEYECGVEAARLCPRGTVFRCMLTPTISCAPVMSDIDVASMNENGTIAAIRHIFKKPPPETHGEAFIVPDVFSVEVRAREGRTIAKQSYTSKKGISLRINLAPGGGKAFMSWNFSRVCGDRLCHSDRIVDFPDRE
jgi:hypothetical protein